MKTDELIDVLSRSAAPVDRRAGDRRFAALLALGPVMAVAAVLGLWGPRPDLAAAAGLPLFWLKVGLPAAVALAAALVIRRLGHPGMRLGLGLPALLLPIATLWVLGAGMLAAAPPGARLPLLLGSSWWQCTLAIAALSIPATGAAIAALRRLAPTRPVLGGAVCGLFGGSAAAVAWSLYCPEMAVPFVAAWYVLGMLAPAAAGALLGRRLLRW